MANFVMDMAFGTSLRSHIPDMQSHGLYGAIWRVGEGLYNAIDNISDQLSVSHDYSLPYGYYYAIHPWYDAVKQIDRFMGNWQGGVPQAVYLDCELHGDESPEKRDEVYHQAFEYCKQKLASMSSKIPILGNYSGFWFVDQWCPNMKAWLGDAPYWNAYYPVFHPSTWDQFDKQLKALPTPQSSGYPTVAMWQFAGSLITSMVPHQVDYSRIDDPVMYEYLFKGGPAPVVVPPQPPVQEAYEVVVDTLSVRSGPGTSWPVVYYIHKGDKLLVVEKSGAWGRFATGRWCNISAIYCKKL